MDDGETKPLISVLMSVYNGAPYLRAALDSILCQTLEDFEFIIIDDGSTDGSTEILQTCASRDPRLRLVIQENRGLTAALNAGLNLARGKYIARMDADDVARSDRLERQAAALDADPKLVLVGAQVELITEDGVRLGLRRQGSGHADIRRRLLLGDGGAMTHPAVMFRAPAARQVGGFDERFSTAQDLDFFLRLSELGSVENLGETLLEWRQHKLSVNSTKSSSWKQMKALAIQNTIERIGAKQYAEELFAAASEFNFPDSDFDLAMLALKNGRRREARRLFWREFRNGRRSAAALKQLVKLAAAIT